MESISIVPSTVLNSIYVNERKNCTGGSVVLEDRYTVYFMQVTDTTNISIDSSLLDVPTNCSVQFKLVVWSDKANVLNFSGCSIEQIEVRRGESVFTVQWTSGSNVWSVIPDVLGGYNEVALKAWSRPFSASKAIASIRDLYSQEANTKTFDVFGQLNPSQINNSNTGNWSYGSNAHNNSTAFVWSIKPFMIRSIQFHYPANASAQNMPTSVSVYGTNDHKTWTAIISNQSTTFSAGANDTITVSGTNNSYRTFKFEFVQDNSDNSFIPPISILGYEGALFDNRHYDWMIPAISDASGGYTATVDTSNLADIRGNAYTLLMGNDFFYAQKTSGLAWTFTYEVPTPKKPCGIYFRTRYNSGDSSIGHMAIFGSNDSGTTWTKISELDSGALYGNVAPGNQQDYTYMFACDSAYTSFKIEIYSPYNGGIGFQLMNLNFIEALPDANTVYDTIIPELSSNSQDGYVVSTTNTVDSTSAYMLFDGVANDYCAGTWSDGQWAVNIQLPQATVINGVRIRARSSGTDYDQAPYAFMVQGSNNNTDWTILDSENLGSSYWNTSGQLGTFPFENSTAYVYYRIVCTAAASSSYCGMAEIGLTANAYLPSVNWIEDVYIVPVMSSDSQDGYVASAISYYNSCEPYKLFDRYSGQNNQWITNTGTTISGSWIKIQLPTAAIADVFNIQAPNEYGVSSRFPTAFKIQGSNDDSSWTDILDVSGVSFSQNEVKSWTTNNTTAYLYYRILISANGGAEYLAIGEWNLIKRIVHTN